jgi:hypothetical protein
MRKLLVALSVLSLVAGSMPAIAAQCRDTKGRFVKCPQSKAQSAHCRDAKGKYAKCGTKGAKPA